MKTSSDWLRLIQTLQSQNEADRFQFMSPIRERLLGEGGRSGKHLNIYERKCQAGRVLLATPLPSLASFTHTASGSRSGECVRSATVSVGCC